MKDKEVLPAKERIVYLEIAQYLKEKNENENALNYLEKAFNLSLENNDKIEILNAQIKIYEKLKDYNNIANAIKTIIDILLTDVPIKIEEISNAYVKIADSMMSFKEYDKAIEAYKQSLEFNYTEKFNAKNNFYLANAYQTKGSYEEALKIYKTIISNSDDIFWIKNAESKIAIIETIKK